MENPSKDIQNFDQSRLKDLVFQLESFEIEYKSRLRKTKLNIHKGVAFALSAIALIFWYLVYLSSNEAAIVLLLSSMPLLIVFTSFSFSNLEYFSKNIPQLFERCHVAQLECEELLYELISQHKVLNLKEILQKSQAQDSSITALMASLVQSNRVVEYLDVNTATYFYAVDESFFIAMKETKNTTPTNYSELTTNIQKKRYRLDSKYVEHFKYVNKNSNTKDSLTTIFLTTFGILSFVLISVQVSLFFFTFLFLYKGLSTTLNREHLDQKLDVKGLSEEHLEKGINKCDTDLENLILLSISNHPNQKVQGINSMLELGTIYLQDLLDDLVQSNKIKEDIELETGLSTYSISDDYYMVATREELERDIFTRYLAHFDS